MNPDAAFFATLKRTQDQPAIGPNSSVEVDGKPLEWLRFFRKLGVRRPRPTSQPVPYTPAEIGVFMETAT